MERSWSAGWVSCTEDELPCGGTGLCPEAQADGVPCPLLGQECRTCGRARRARQPAGKPDGGA